MKITFILKNSANIRGGVRVIAIYAKYLQKRGHQVFIASLPQAHPTLGQQLRSLIKGKILTPPKNNSSSYFNDLGVIVHTIESQRPIVDSDLPDGDVVIATWWETAEWVEKLSQKKGTKIYFIQHHELHDYLPINRVKATYLLPLHKIVIAQWLKDLMFSDYGDEQVSLVANSVDMKQFNAPPRSKQSIPTVGLMYSSLDWKGCDISLKAFTLAQKTIPQLHLIAFGQKDISPNLPLPYGTKYIQQPSQETIKDIYASCDAWLFSSRLEGFGLPILEAMACRTPVIGTPAGAALELIAKGGGILVKPEDPEDMARAIIDIINLSNQQWQVVSDAAYTTATSYTWEDATTLFEAALYTAIERTKNGELGETKIR
ncbi:glycosyltransferase family 4 protein [Crocosphaera sp. UHCC 0190]|uniref:glycosyltransferase family 4 protein n=1 Tax=Crocosphaera sp. UHCC 0190 TaxID=3110246 RepID=UPI002B1F36BF|nr:glycosyltransferase family 4 protein [Crocosphaera sp. UHCC 0190]MEA5509910.1 glycosyltransferase family 4 protein [Crocosphaera sp. UHCC 0190]